MASAVDWPQEASDLSASHSVRFGMLQNGMRYVIAKAAVGTSQVSFRFRIDVGSMHETAEKNGLAHFLEHMAFRGSTNVPDDQVSRQLARLGLSLGADTNGFTGVGETVFMYDLPRAGEKPIDAVLLLVDELASKLSLTPESIESERKIMLAEENIRDTQELREHRDLFRFLYPGQPLGDHDPIGDADVLKRVGAADLRRFYEEFYRPERACLIVVGDIDPAAIEQKISMRFSSWVGRGPAGVNPAFGPPRTRGRTARAYVAPNIPGQTGIYWTSVFDDEPDSRARREKETITEVAIGAFRRRLQENPSVRGGAVHLSVARSVTVTSMVAATSSDGGKTALRSLIREYRSAVDHGLSRSEVDLQIGEMRKQLQADAADAANRTPAALANDILQHFDAGMVFTDKALDLELFEQTIHTLTVEQVNTALRRCFEGNGPLLHMSGSQPLHDIDTLFAALLTEDYSSTRLPSYDTKTAQWPYTNFGVASGVSERSDIADLGVASFRFDNGIHLLVKQTTFHPGQVLIAASFGAGRAGLPKDRPPALLSTGATSTLIDGGLKELSAPEIWRSLAKKAISLWFRIGERHFTLMGQTTPQDLNAELQLLTAYFTAPGWRSDGFDQIRAELFRKASLASASPDAVFISEFERIVHDGDERWAVPTIEQIHSAKLDDVRAILQPALEKSPVDVVVVGDITPEQAVQSVAATLGALPSRETRYPSRANDVRFPAGSDQTPIILTHQGRADQGMAIVAWKTRDLIGDMQTVRTVRVLQLIVQNRLFERLRNKLGVAYRIGGDNEVSTDYPGYGFMFARANLSPDKFDLFYNEVSEIVADLKEREVSTDELERARGPFVEGIIKERQTNEAWLLLLNDIRSDPNEVDVIRTLIPALQAVDPVDVQKASRAYLTKENELRIVIRGE